MPIGLAALQSLNEGLTGSLDATIALSGAIAEPRFSLSAKGVDITIGAGKTAGGRPVDGKTLRRSYQQAGRKGAIHMISAFSANQRLVLGQKKVTDKSNEITAIPKLLDLLTLNGAIVTIDAMGCQRAIAARILAFDVNGMAGSTGPTVDIKLTGRYEAQPISVSAGIRAGQDGGPVVETLDLTAPGARAGLRQASGRYERDTCRRTRSRCDVIG